MPFFRTILFVADFSDSSKEAFRVACALTREEATRMIVLHVVEQVYVAEQPIFYGEMGVPVPILAENQAHHEALRERLREVYAPDHPLRVEYHLRDGVAAEEILRAGEESGCDLIVMGTHGRTGLERLLAGSVAEAVMRGARCPVLTVRSPAPTSAPRGGTEDPVTVTS